MKRGRFHVGAVGQEFGCILGEFLDWHRCINPDHYAYQNIVWAVVYGNYDPFEVNSLWHTEARAKQRASELQGDYRVIEWEIYS